jgi:hypothetical protein
MLSSGPVDWHPFCAIWVKGGQCACPQVIATRAWVWAVGCAKPKEQHITPKLQDSVNMRCTMKCRSKESNLWSCKALVLGRSCMQERPHLKFCHQLCVISIAGLGGYADGRRILRE